MLGCTPPCDINSPGSLPRSHGGGGVLCSPAPRPESGAHGGEVELNFLKVKGLLFLCSSIDLDLALDLDLSFDL